MPADLQIKNPETIEASARRFMLLRNARPLRLTVKRDDDFAIISRPVGNVSKRPRVHPAIGLDRRS